MNYQLTRLKYFASTHRFTIVIVLFILVVWGGSFATFSYNVYRSIEMNEAAAREKESETNRLLEELQGKKEAEQNARAEADAKKREKERAAAVKKAEEEKKLAQHHQQPKPAGVSGEACNRATSHNNPASIDVVVNKKHCLVPLSYAPPDLVTTNGATLSAKAAGAFNKMFAAAAAAGQPFIVSSSYRSYQTQVSTYNYWVSVNGQAGADTVSARPGFSEHQTGFVIDVGAGSCILDCFGGTSQYKWFQANAADFGFIQRYYAGYEHITGYAGEEWHYRYVGPEVAKDMKARDIKTLEQYWNIEGGDYR